MAAIETFGIDVSAMHWDMTSISVHGEYEQNQEGFAAPKYGHPKDRRADLEQIQAGIAVSADGVIAVCQRRRHMISDHHGLTAGRATLLVRAVDEIPGTHRPAAQPAPVIRTASYRAAVNITPPRRGPWWQPPGDRMIGLLVVGQRVLPGRIIGACCPAAGQAHHESDPGVPGHLAFRAARRLLIDRREVIGMSASRRRPIQADRARGRGLAVHLWIHRPTFPRLSARARCSALAVKHRAARAETCNMSTAGHAF